MNYFHSEEKLQVWWLERYNRLHPETRYLIQFGDGESYICLLDAAYDSDNAGELDIEMDNPLYDEFHQLSMEILDTIQPGLRPYNQWLSLDYRDFPTRITDLDTKTTIYPPQ